MVRSSRSAIVAVAVVGAGVVLAACSGGSGRTTTTNTPSPTRSTPAAVEQPAQVAVSASELGAGWQQRLIPGGSQVQGEVTLDLCGGDYRSEALRTARHQIAFRLGRLQLSNEVVRYAPGGAQLAYAELKKRLSTCPKTPVTMPEAGGIRARWMLARLPNDPSWPRDTVAVRGTVTAQGHTSTSIGIYEFDGQWLAAVYTQDATSASLRVAERMATIEATKLRAATGH